MPDEAAIASVLGYAFRDPRLLAQALRHASWCNEQPEPRPSDSQRLEFLGDAVLGLVVGHRLMTRFPQGSERDLSVTRQQIVSEAGLSAVAAQIGLGAWLSLGKGEEKSGGRDKPRVLADALEALFGAIYQDGGFEAARGAIEHVLGARIATVELKNFYDFKTRLQETAQSRRLAAPTYRVVEEHGADNAKQFVVAAMIGDDEWGRAVGTSKKEAEQMAAAEANFRLEASDAGVRPKPKAKPRRGTIG